MNIHRAIVSRRRNSETRSVACRGRGLAASIAATTLIAASAMAASATTELAATAPETSDPDLDAFLYPAEPADSGDEDDELDTDVFVDACTDEYGDTPRHYSTEASARDMDLIREALEEDTITYIGLSYGIYLGAV